MAQYGLERVVPLSYEEALRRTKEALQEQGFGVLTEIDVRATLQKKLGVEYPPCAILGACNPPLAYQALQAEPDVALLLPCNVVVREEEGVVKVSIMDPDVMARFTGNPALEPLAREARARLEKVLERLTSAEE